jgi:cytochrome c peroxidase
MHNGRFNTLDEVINFYSIGIHPNSPNIDPLIEFSSQGGVQLNPQERQELKAFLLTLSDPEFINNNNFSNPF